MLLNRVSVNLIKCVCLACSILLQSVQARKQWLVAGEYSQGLVLGDSADVTLEAGAAQWSTTGRSLQKADCETYRSGDGTTVRKECELSGGHALAATAIALIATFSCIAICCLPLLILLCCAAKASKRNREQQLAGQGATAGGPPAYTAHGYPMGPAAPVGTVAPYTPDGAPAVKDGMHVVQPPHGLQDQGQVYPPPPPPMHGLHAGDVAPYAAGFGGNGRVAAANAAAVPSAGM